MKYLALISMIFAFGCACPHSHSSASVMDTLYFGGSVSQADWEDYLAKEVTPRFPDGLTHWQAKGQWREGKDDVAKEGSEVLQILHARGPEAD